MRSPRRARASRTEGPPDGREGAFAIGAPVEIVLAGRKLLSVAYQSGARARRPRRRPAGRRAWLARRDVDLLRSGGDKLPSSPAHALDHPALSIAAGSLRVGSSAR